MHAINGVTGLFTPLSLGYNGAGTALGPPWIYLSGPPPSWSLNRATGKRLTQLGPEFTASALSPPGSE